MSSNTRSSSIPGEQRSKQIHSENLPNAGAKTKISNIRPALGTLNQNVSSGRVQPFRAAKQNLTTEGFFTANALPLKQNIPTLQIYDETSKEAKPNKAEDCENVLPNASTQLHPALTALPFPRQPLITLTTQNSSLRSADSPMVLDTIEEEERLNVFNIDASAGIYGLSEYAEEIFEHIREVELLHRPKPNYMRKQQDITPGMRSILVDWLVEVADEYKLHTETTHLAVNYIDRFLSQMAVLRGKLQLVGTAAMFLAAKFEEIYPPDVDEFAYITDNTYGKKQILRMEHLILKVLNFDVAVPTSIQFLKRFLKAADANRKVEFLAQYLCELALVEFDCVQYLPSMLSASAVCLASFTVSGKIWDETMEHYMKYDLSELLPTIKRLCEIFEKAETHPQKALFEKYKDPKFECVSKIKPPLTLPFDEMEAEDEC